MNLKIKINEENHIGISCDSKVLKILCVFYISKIRHRGATVERFNKLQYSVEKVIFIRKILHFQITSQTFLGSNLVRFLGALQKWATRKSLGIANI